jgi:ABC-2 type transport system ATP-binding protein
MIESLAANGFPMSTAQQASAPARNGTGALHPPPKAAIELNDVCWKPGKSFEVKNLSLRVPAGSIYGFLGANGSGKTTTIRMLLGMLKPDSGEVRVLDGQVPKDMPRILSQLGYVPERPHIYPTMTVAEALRFHASFYPNWDKGWEKELIERLALDVDRRVARMSKGETGKLLVMLALAQRPQLLVLDEPTDGLDPVIRRDVITAVLDYVGESGATVFISSHLVHELERICDWVGVMDNGRILAELPIDQFKNEIKRIRLLNAPIEPLDAPFVLLNRERANGKSSGETWVVRGWRDGMHEYFEAAGATVRDVVDLDLEDGFVELLRASRSKRTGR